MPSRIMSSTSKKEIALMCNRVSAMMMRLDMCAMYMSIAVVIR